MRKSANKIFIPIFYRFQIAIILMNLKIYDTFRLAVFLLLFALSPCISKSSSSKN